MKASELRIGNWFKEDILEQTFAQITAEQILDFYDDPLDDFYKPIPLTEEWLLKFGFDLINNEYHQSRNHELKLYWTVNKNKMIPEFNEKRFVTGYDFKYVHQLQNLYFALTGQEL